MKRIYVTILLLCPILVFAQSGEDEIISELNINNMSAPVRIKGDLFNKYFDLRSTLKGNKATGKSIAYAGGIWIGGVENNQLHLAAATYRQNGIDYGNGPLTIASAVVTQASKDQFNHTWKVEERTIDDFKLNYNKPGYTIPMEILTWPAHGDSINGFASQLAPFVDMNLNGIYEPMLGDYPQIKGQQQLFWIFNDNSAMHTESEGLPLGVEVHASAYGYVCDQTSGSDPNKAINNSTFYSYKIINRSNKTYDNFRVAFWIDSDIGYYGDDRMGSNPTEDYAYWYNGDTLDESPDGFGTMLPAAALLMLKNVKDANGIELKGATIATYYNDFSADKGNPSRPEQYNNYMSGKWRDGRALTYGGSGHGGTDSTDVSVFPGKNDRLNRTEWTEENSGIPVGDRRLLVASKPTTLKPGEAQEVEFAIVYTPTSSYDKDYILGELHKDVMKVKGWYAANNFPACSSVPLGLNTTPDAKVQQLEAYPNPVSQQLHLQMSDAQPIISISVYSLNGQLMPSDQKTGVSTVDMSNYAPGLYFIKVQTGNGVFVKKVVKN